MKLYAIRNKETGELYRVAGKPAVFTKPDAPTKHLVNESRELVTLRIEPTEPCEWCQKIPDDYVAEEREVESPMIVERRRYVRSTSAPTAEGGWGMITVENFSPTNREKVIGDSLYRICQFDYFGTWYIFEVYTTTGGAFATARSYARHDPKEVIDAFNSITTERALTGEAQP